jgi:hypothetical protein
MRPGNICAITEWEEPSIVSVIFAPRPENDSPVAGDIRWERSHVTRLLRSAPPPEIEVIKNVNVIVRQSLEMMYERIRKTLIQSHINSVQRTLSANYVPGRNFPFASHINLVSGTTEGLNFDADDYREE